MKGGFHRVTPGLAAVLVLSACDGRSPWASTEQRINDAIPVGAAARQAKSRLDELLLEDADSKARIDAEYSTKLKLRALTCAQGNEPSILDSAAEIRRKLPTNCFSSFDKELVAWANGRRLTALLNAPALRPVPAVARQVFSTTNQVNTIRFASSAGIAVVTSNNTVEVIDIGNDESVYMDTALRTHPSSLDVSPNGRAFAVGSADGGVILRESASGEVLAEYPEHWRLIFLDSLTALLRRKDYRGVDVLDLASGKTTAAKGLSDSNFRVLPVPGEARQFVAGSPRSVSRFELRRDESGVRIALLDQQSGTPSGWSENSAETTSDGGFFVQGGREISVTDLATLQTEQIPLSGFMAVSATPLPDPTEMLMQASVAVGAEGQMFFVYSLKDRVFSPVEGNQLAGNPGFSGVRTVYIPSLKRVGVLTGKSVKLIDKLDRGFRYSSEAFTQHLQEVVQERQQKMAAETAKRMGYTSIASVNGIPVRSGPIADLARDAQIEAVGVYEPAGSSSGGNALPVRRRAPITVTLRRSAKPVVLVLSSYEAVDWRLIVGSGVQLKAVLLAGYKESTVTGAGSVRVVTIGSMHAYELGSGGYAQLQREVIRWTGRPIDAFQGKYAGSLFMVGGL